MADHGSPEDSAASFCVYTGFIDEGIERYLWHLEDEPKKEVAECLLGEFSFEELDLARGKLFDRAVEYENGRNRGESDRDDRPPNDGGERAASNPFILIKRRAIFRVAFDLCEIYLFLIGKAKAFPTNMLRRQTMGPSECLLANAIDQLEMIPERSVNASTTSDNAIDQDIIANDPHTPQIPTIIIKDTNNETVIVADQSGIHQNGNHDDEYDDGKSGFWDVNETVDLMEKTSYTRLLCDPDTVVSHRKIDRINKADEGLSFVLFSEPKMTPKANTTCTKIQRSSPGDEHESEPYRPGDYTTNRDLSTAMRSRDVGRLEYFFVPAPREKTKQPGCPKKHRTCDKKESKSTSGDSQSSFLKELDELHDRVIASTPKIAPKDLTRTEAPEIAKQTLEKPTTLSNKPGVNMATQTQPNVIPDCPVLKSEFDSQMESVDRSLTDHERRVRSNEIWRTRNERKVDRIDAEYHHQMKVLCESNKGMVGDIKTLRESVSDIKESNSVMANDLITLKNVVDEMKEKMERCVCTERVEQIPSSGDDTPGCKRTRKEYNTSRSLRRTMTRTVSTPIKKDTMPTKRATRKKGENIYRSLMRVAKKVISPQNWQTKQPKSTNMAENTTPIQLRTSPELVRDSPPIDALDLRTSNGRETGMIGVGSPNYGTPFPGVQRSKPMDVSWADEDNEDTQAIEFYLSTVKNGDEDQTNPQPTQQQAVSEYTHDALKDGQSKMPPMKQVESQTAKESVPTSRSGTSVAESVRDRISSNRYENTKSREDSLKNVEVGRSTTPVENRPSQRDAETSRLPLKKPAWGQKDDAIAPIPSQNSKPAQDPRVPKPSAAPQKHTSNAQGSPPDNRVRHASRGSLVKVVGKNGWTTVMRVPGKSGLKPLQAGNMRPKKDIFVRGLAATIYDSKEEMEEAVREYCEERGVGIFYMRIMPLQPGSDVANCKIGVAEEDADTVMDDDFWPKKVTVREWRFNPKDIPQFGMAPDRKEDF